MTVRTPAYDEFMVGGMIIGVTVEDKMYFNGYIKDIKDIPYAYFVQPKFSTY